ncbi:MAG: hypothetical protein EOO56_14615 [Hymenobacter sp.]|nr:MAG: hypothetical protein EOO56_14615 [Hymenobacter sp.]
MENTFPFEVKFIGDAEQFYQLSADFEEPKLLLYKLLLDKYRSPNGLISLVDNAALVIEETVPDLLDHMDFNEESYLLDMHVDSAESLQTFVAKVYPIFQSLTLLEAYVKRIANG